LYQLQRSPEITELLEDDFDELLLGTELEDDIAELLLGNELLLGSELLLGLELLDERCDEEASLIKELYDEDDELRGTELDETELLDGVELLEGAELLDVEVPLLP